MARYEFPFTPRLLSSALAAGYLGISETHLRTLGLPRRVLGKRRLYDRYELDAFVDGLEFEDSEADQLKKDQKECDRLFGLTE